MDLALQAAMYAFWKKGYTATSMADLMEAMGLQKGSIYKAFGNKHELFLSALRYYLNTAFDSLKTQMQSVSDPLDALRIYLYSAVEMCSATPSNGCFAHNTLTELGQDDMKASTVLHGHFEKVGQLIEELVEEAQRSGQVRNDEPAATIAEYLITVQLGIVSSAKQAGQPGPKARVVDFALSQIASP